MDEVNPHPNQVMDDFYEKLLVAPLNEEHLATLRKVCRVSRALHPVLTRTVAMKPPDSLSAACCLAHGSAIGSGAFMHIRLDFKYSAYVFVASHFWLPRGCDCGAW